MKKITAAVLAVMMVLSLAACAGAEETQKQISTMEQSVSYSYTEYPLERNGIDLHLDCLSVMGTNPDRNVLLIHGVTYSSHEFDIDYEDYSLVRFLAREGYAVWRLDIAGFGQSEEVEDGFLPDSDYAAEDIHAAVDKICEVSGQDKIDLLGWSWGAVTASRFVANHPEHINRLVLYAPILSGLGEVDVTEPFHHNTWEHAADDFQKNEDGTFDYSIADPVVIEMLCSSSWHYDKESSPNGGRRDICVDQAKSLIDLKKITVPTLVICGDKDPYLDFDRVNAVLDDLPDGSALEVIEGASHVAYIEKPYHHDFQDRLIRFLGSAQAADEGSNVLDAIRKSNVLKVGTAGDYQPMSYLDPETNTYVGFDARLAEDLAASLGVKIEYVETSWPTLMEDTLDGKFDLAICGITVTDARKEQALMSDGYLENGKTVLCRAEDADKYTSLEAINKPEVRVMENPGGLNEKFARENLPDATLIIHDVNQEIPGLVASGEADVMITEVMEAGYYVGQDERLAAPLIYEPFTHGQLGVLMPKGSEDLLDYVNEFLEEEKKTGRINEMAEEYIYRYVQEEMDEAA
ncbi:MAG: alpha/beta fold hydrolase [Lachnospiraceae bacterium]|nr:alpha/beta fold hydrolase [Lachnospiraceae bacterium]